MNSSITTQDLQSRLQQALEPSLLEVIDESHLHQGHAGTNGTGSGSHFRVRICAQAFAGKPLLARHRLVYDSLRDLMDQGLHALAIEAQAPTA